MTAHRSFPKTKHLLPSRLADSAPCPCGSTKIYGACCGLWHTGFFASPKRHAPSPDALMRSRYSAYVLQLADYLLSTWHSSTAPGEIDFPPTKWLGLDIKAAETRNDAGVVEFVARYRDNTGCAGRLHETSRFVREGTGDDARWLYIDGQFSGEEPTPVDSKPFRTITS
jgi:SEC-C motif domain protein